MKIGVDVRSLTSGRQSGVEEYVRNLIRAILEADRKNEYILFCNAYGRIFEDFSWATCYSNVSLKRFYFPNKLFNFFLWYLNWPKIDKLIGGVDYFWMPNIMFSSVSPKTKLILTVHDLSFFNFYETFSRKRRLWHWLVNPRKMMREANKIVTVSDFIQDDLESNYQIKGKTVSVLSGIGEKFKPIDRNNFKMISIKEKYQLPYRFMLFLGTLEPRKNILAIIQAFEYFHQWSESLGKEENKKFKLVLAGRKGWLCEEIFSSIKNSPAKEQIMFIDGIDEEDKEYVFNLASLFVYPSLYEGFGFPPLEAMASGVPVIASNVSSMPEVLGKSALLVNPNCPSEIFEAMRNILGSESLREKMKQEGIIRAKHFKWEMAARKMINLFSD